MPGGDLHWIWTPYARYTKIDKIYGFEAVESKNGFTNAQSAMNVVETLLNFVYVYLGSAHYLAPLIGYTTASLTLAKTVLYGLQEYYCDYCSVGHNTLYDLVVFWIVPNGMWIVVPTYIVYVLGGDLAKSLRIAAQVKRGKAE